MWRPGTSKPNSTSNGGADAKSLPPPQQQASTTKSPPNGDSANKKKLSGATMGMRFMKRKQEAEEARQQTINKQQKQPENDDMEWTATNDKDTQGSATAVEEPDSSIISQTAEATPCDMFGAKSDLIGRRSFGGFRPHVSDSYKTAWHAYQHGISNKDSNKHVSDEELLRRYKSYVTGKEESAPIIGNLQEKLKKRKSSSPHKKSGKKKR